MSRREGGKKHSKRRPELDDDADSGFDRTRPDAPDGWRDVVRPDYSYPDEIDDLRRRDRRQAKRSWRRDDYAERMAWLRQQRQSEPTSPVTVVVAVLILAIVVLGFGGGLPRLLGRDEPADKNVGLLTPSLPPEQPGASEPVPTAEPSSVVSPTSSISTPPVLTERPTALATTAVVDVVTKWARMFYTRDPSAETYSELVAKTGPFITDQVGDSLVANEDSTYEALKTDSGKSIVASVTVTTPKPDSAPVDTPTRISRLVTVTIDITGKRPDRIVLPLVVTLVPEDAAWVVSDLNGGSGP
ncbi:hypothetical protein [Kribbella sp. CA-293567]|uniref:hypothetical protein n=1 Tax=Kribbella sp. CA-293567 TaxID=3002436 RepID=UPI0022DD8C84|nr:hypothetical protein [Kribbella sp. CA-293567]WBQ02906.1 hypothetical protein OX958_23330 [Kribbella sp. CA-293567]